MPSKLMTAIEAREVSELGMLKSLLNSGEKVDGEPTDKITPLMAILMQLQIPTRYSADYSNALQDGRDTLIKAGADVNDSLFKACYYGYAGVAEQLIWSCGAGVNAIYLKNKNKDVNLYYHTPLMAAILGENSQMRSVMAKLLIDNGAGLNTAFKQSNSNTALHLAVKNGYAYTVQVLLRAGARTDVLNTDLKTPLHIAAAAGFLDRDSNLLRHSKEEINKQDKDGNTPLLLALRFGDHKTVRALLGANASVEHVNKNGDSAVNMAILSNSAENLQALLVSGKIVFDAENHFGLEPLKLAISIANEKIVKLLLDAGADKNTMDPIIYNELKDKSNSSQIDAHLKSAKDKQMPAVSALVNFAFDPFGKYANVYSQVGSNFRPKL